MGTTEVNDDPQAQQETESTDSRVGNTRTTPYYTIYILIAISVVFLAELTQPIGNVRAIVGLEKSLFAEGEFWRIFTSSVVHDGIIHILFNGYALWILGRITESISNRANVPVIFVLAALGGGLLSFAFLPEGNSVGASSGIIGILGYLTIYGYRRRKLISDSLLKGMVFNIALITFLGVFVIPSVDNFGHLGGLIAGVLYGLFQIPDDLYEDTRDAGPVLNYAGIASLAFVFLTAAITTVMILVASSPVT